MKQAATITQACEELIELVRFERAGFTRPGEHMNSSEYTAEIREATRLYVETWVVPKLEAIRDGDIEKLKRLM